VRESDDKDAMEVAAAAIAARHSDRADAARGFRAFGIASKVLLRRNDSASCWSRSRKSSSTSMKFFGVVVQKIRSAKRDDRAQAVRRRTRAHGVYAPTRGLIGYQGELLTDTRGTAS